MDSSRAGCGSCWPPSPWRRRRLPQFKLEGRAEGRDDHVRPEERRRLVAGLRRSARQRMEKSLGVQIPFVENVPENADRDPPAGRALHLARATTSSSARAFGYSDTFKELAAKYPNVAFLNGAGTTNGPNLAVVLWPHLREPVSLRHGRRPPPRRPASSASSRPTRSASSTGRSTPIQLGAKQINPNATTTVIFTGAWNDPVKERAAAEALIEQGIDVIGQHVDTPAVQIVAQEKGMCSTGHHRDMTRVRAQGDAVLVGLGVGPVPRAPRSRRSPPASWEPAPYGAFFGIGRRHRHRLLRRRGSGGRQGQDHGRARGDHRRQARLCRPARRRRRQGTRRRPARCSATAICGRWTGSSPASSARSSVH